MHAATKDLTLHTTDYTGIPTAINTPPTIQQAYLAIAVSELSRQELGTVRGLTACDIPHSITASRSHTSF